MDIGLYGQELEGKFCVVYTRSGVPKLSSWAIGKLIENGHFVESYLECFAIESIDEMEFEMKTVEWDGVINAERIDRSLSSG